MNNFYNKIDDSISSDKKSSNATLYHYEVIKLLMNSKSMKSNGESLSQEEVFYLHKEIEDLTMNFDEKSVFKSVPSLIKLLICQDMITAKEYLMQKCGLYENDLTYIQVFGQYTLEAIIIHVLRSMFNCVQDLSVIRVSTLIEQIDSTVQVQAVNMGMNKASGQENVKLSLNQDKK